MSNSGLKAYVNPSISTAPRAVYVHVPFCIHRCGYCDFTLVSGRDELIPSYLKALANEFSTLNQRYPVDTVFIGGGTPTHLSASQLSSLLQLIQQHFDLQPNAEFSVEANPDGLTTDQLQALADGGVNRVSLGVQSFDASVLQTLERKHVAAEARDVVHLVSERFSSVSLDLIFGVPGQTESSWEQTVAIALNLPINHISTYGLTYEKGTRFFQQRETGALRALPDDVEGRMYAHAIKQISNAGLQHYEISSFARLEAQCRHNINYWDASEYFAFGPGAARYVDGIRSTNARSVTRWLNSWLKSEPALQDIEQLSHDAKVREAAFLGMRRIEGISLPRFQQRWEIDLKEFAAEAIQKNVANGWLEIINEHLRLTSAGIFFADSVAEDFLG